MVRLEAGEAAAEEEEEVKVEDKEEEDVEQEEEVKVIMVKVGTEDQGQIQDTLATRPKDMLIFPRSKPVSGTGPSGSPHTSVWSPPPAPGKTSGSPSPTTEGLTSPATRRQVT